MSIAPGNENFVKILDSNLNSKVFEALVNAGILPQGFQVIVGSVSPLATGEGHEILDSAGNQIRLAEGQHIAHLSVAVSTTLASGGSATVQVGLAATATGTVAEGLTADTAFATINTSGLAQNNHHIVDGTNNYLVAEVTTAALTAGELQVVLVVV